MTAQPPTLTRRAALGAGLGIAATAVLAGCQAAGPGFVTPTGAAVKATERARVARATGRSVTTQLRAAESTVDIGGRQLSTWSFGQRLAPVVRATVGDRMQITLDNRLPATTTIHWHGLALRNDMDGVPNLTQKPIAAGSSFRYDFTAPHPGTYWFHPHVGTQLDRGLYGALIIADPKEPLSYDQEWVVVLDDWLDGTGTNPDRVLTQLKKGMGSMGMGGMVMRQGDMLMGATSKLLGGDAGDVYYPYHLINGRSSADPETFQAQPGQRIRIRLINASGDTAYRVALGGHRMTVAYSDGFPVVPTEVDGVLIGMGERHDVVVQAGLGAFPLVAEAEGKKAQAFAILRTAPGAAPAATARPTELDGKIGVSSQWRAAPSVVLPRKAVDRQLSLRLTGDMSKYNWGVNGVAYSEKDPLRGAMSVRSGERVRLKVINETSMWHPFHLHGHTYQHANGGPRKDTSVVLPKATLTVEFDADNPGRWLAHCHNIYHAEAGMMTVLGYSA